MAFEKSSRSELTACVILALLAAAIIAASALRSDAAEGPLLVLLAACVTLGCAFPSRYLFTGLTVGLAIPVLHVTAHLTDWRTVDAESHLLWTFLPLVPALAASAIGALLRRAIA